MKLSDVLTGVPEVNIRGNPDENICGISYSSKTVQPGDLFAALKGEKADERSDIYALGVLTYQMLTGELPYKPGNDGALLMAHLSQEPPDPRAILPEISSNTVKAIRQAMAKTPANRFETAGQFTVALTVSN